MISIEEDTSFAFVVEKGAKVDTSDNMPAPFELFFESFFDVFGGVFEVGDLAADHLDVDVLSDEHGVLLVLGFHVAEFYFGGDGNVGWGPVFGNPCPAHLLLFLFLVCLLFFLGECCHFVHEILFIYLCNSKFCLPYFYFDNSSKLYKLYP